MSRYRLHWLDGAFNDVIANNLTEALDFIGNGPNEWKLDFYEESPTTLIQEMVRSFKGLLSNVKIPTFI